MQRNLTIRHQSTEEEMGVIGYLGLITHLVYGQSAIESQQNNNLSVTNGVTVLNGLFGILLFLK